MIERSFIIFVDFDGTITKIDVGENLFLEFGDRNRAQYLINNWNSELINSWDGWRELCKTIDTVNQEAIEAYLQSIEIDGTFKKFVDYCEVNQMPLKIISDGFDYYIKKILDKENLGSLEFSSNIMKLTTENKFYPVFPNAQEDCKCCANCKRNFVIENSGEDDFTVYIGDGVSDRCPIQYCDFIFAKGSLLRFCETNRITYFPYSDFDDIINRLEELRNKKRLKKRFQAELKRKEIFLQG
jgi:2-hydroxy-3-keto-5-methylthiopentenyl-1-phosphate phosphatase